MVKVRDGKDMSREAEEISDLASYIFTHLKLMEANHPYLKSDYPEYRGLRNRIEQFLVNPPESKTALGILFDTLRKCLHHISEERNAKTANSGQSRQRLIPSNYLPMSFDLLLEDFTESTLHSGQISQLNDTTEDLLFTEGGIEEFPNHREGIRKRILKALVCDYGRAAEIRRDLAEYGDKVFDLLKLSNDDLGARRKKHGVEPLPKGNPEVEEPLEAAVALIILRTRAQISHKRGMRYSAPLYLEPKKV